MESTVQETEASNNAAVAPPLKPVVRLDSYQTDSDFVVSVMAKNLKKEEVSVNFEEQEVKVKAKLSDGSDYEKNICLLHKIRPEDSAFKVMSTKIEIRLRKVTGGLWAALEAEKAVPLDKDAKPAYPSSSTVKHDWDQLERDIKKQEESEPSDDVNELFSKIFNSGDENIQKAMIKSMQESNGTVLSTNWDEVRQKPVEVSPPDSMEYRKWN